MKDDPLKSRVSEDAYPIAVRLRSLADEMLEHSCCPYCILNASENLAHIGELDSTLARLDMPDPRLVREKHGLKAVKSKDPWQTAKLEEH